MISEKSVSRSGKRSKEHLHLKPGSKNLKNNNVVVSTGFEPGYESCLLNRYALTEYPGNSAISSIVFLLAQPC